MQLQVSASYQPTENEVWVDFRSTQDDLETVTLADQLELNLMIESRDTIGQATYIPISNVKADVSFLRPDRNYEVRFRNPQRNLDLWVEAKATYGMTTYVKKVPVGLANASHNSMQLPDNPIFEQDVLDMFETGGSDSQHVPNENIVVLAPPLQNFVQVYDFTTPQAVEEFEGLAYLGGGSRLLIQNQTNQFELQALDQSPWALSSFLFLEEAGANAAPNSFFLNTTPSANGPLATNYVVDAASSLFQSKVDFDYQVSAAAKIWTLRFTQVNGFAAFSEVKVSPDAPIPVTDPTEPMTFSVYAKVRLLNRTTRVENLTLSLTWYDGSTLLTEEHVTIPTSGFTKMSLAQATFAVPPTATNVVPALKLGSIDADDDVELSLLGFQLEAAPNPTTRMLASRAQDEVLIDPYDATNQKIRLEMIAGFASGGAVDRPILQGPLNVSFLADGTIYAEIPGQANVVAPLTFQPGDPLDLTVEHQSGKRIAIFKDGQLLNETPLPTFTQAPGTLTILGVGIELMKLSVFSRRGS